ncbi:MAG: photosystem II stability/assembly factor-like uncharacterized protein [Planctomycetota bacterium]|jgi:photosystem II stability/assembly factor-like uncharacterized protein
MWMLTLLASLAPCQAAPIPDEAALRHLLDMNGDGHLDRYEAALAAMAWVDAREPADEPGSAPTAPEPLRAGQPLGANFKEFDRDSSGTLDKEELGQIGLPGWRLFDTSADRRLDQDEFLSWTTCFQTPATLSVKGRTATLRGELDGSTPGRLLRMLLEHREVNELVLEVAASAKPSGTHEMLTDLVRQSGLTIRVPRNGTVLGSGLDLLRAGSQRIVERGASLQRVQPPSLGVNVICLTDDEIHDLGLRTETEGLQLFATGTSSSLRGLAAVSSEIAWATGSGATVLKTVNAGGTWANVAPASIAGLDVRDVYAISADLAWIMTAGPGDSSRILFTDNGGATWTEQYRETSPQAFLDGLDAFDGDHLIAYGDPMEDGRFRVLHTSDGGVTWTPSETGPLALESGEASFAASGTGLRTLDALRAWIVTGGTKDRARAFWSEDSGQTWTPAWTPVAAEGVGAGAFSVSFREDGTGVLVGGDFLARDVGGVANAAYSVDFGKTWIAPEVGPRGQRAGSTALGNGWFLATGQTGTDISRDGGRTWRAFSSEGFHCVDAALLDGTIWLAGPKGRVARVR